jgi:NAD(P)-dependent dehydrogenase (short-subunit alcohol dehydrogenase family)
VALFKDVSSDSINDKIIIITGANRGIGFELARRLSRNGATVIIGCRNEIRGQEAQDKIGGNCKYINIDLTRFQSIKNFCKVVESNYPRVDVLVNNAGVMCPPFTRTYEGLELTFGVNVIGYFLLTNYLIPLMKNVKASRVVNISSIANYRVKKIEWEKINSQSEYKRMESYSLSNLFRIMFTIELEERLRQNRYETTAVSCHPGVVLTDLFRFLPQIARNSILSKLINKLFLHETDKAILPIMEAITSPKIIGGDFIGFDSKHQFKGIPKIVDANPLAYEPQLRDRLWELSAQITGLDRRYPENH